MYISENEGGGEHGGGGKKERLCERGWSEKEDVKRIKGCAGPSSFGIIRVNMRELTPSRRDDKDQKQQETNWSFGSYLFLPCRRMKYMCVNVRNHVNPLFVCAASLHAITPSIPPISPCLLLNAQSFYSPLARHTSRSLHPSPSPAHPASGKQTLQRGLDLPIDACNNHPSTPHTCTC